MTAAVVQGCGLLAAQEQIDELEAACVVSGTIGGSHNRADPYIVVALHHASAGAGAPPTPVDHVVTRGNGEWFFALEPGRFSLLAFRDIDSDRRRGLDDPVYHVDGGTPIDCIAGARFGGIEIATGYGALEDGPDPGVIDVDRHHPGERETPSALSLGQFTAFGEVVTLDDPRFALDRASRSLWRPAEFLREGHAGVYFLEPYDPDRIPVLFIHGINGSPRNFSRIVEALDTERFQPWFYYYPSGIPLQASAGLLAQIMDELEIGHDIERIHVIAHSMGGLVGHAYLDERSRRGSTAAIPRFITVATPWGGHSAAQLGIDYSPVVIPVWRDMAPASEFVGRMFADGHPLTNEGPTDLYVLFGHRSGGVRSRITTDGVVTLASMLRPEAQEHAHSLVGIDDTHVGILRNERTIATINALLNHSR